MKKEACNHQIGIRVSKSFWEEIERVAASMNITGTEYCRRAIVSQLSQDKATISSDNHYVTKREVEQIVNRILCEKEVEYSRQKEGE